MPSSHPPQNGIVQHLPVSAHCVVFHGPPSDGNIMSDLLFIIYAIVMASAGVASVMMILPWLAWTTIAIVDFYLFLLLLVSAKRSDLEGQNKDIPAYLSLPFPSRVVGMFVLPLLAVALITSYAGLYLSPPYLGHFSQQMTQPIDAVYASAVTMMTVGYGDYAPTSADTKALVLGQFASTTLLFFANFPLLISRVSTWKDRT